MNHLLNLPIESLLANIAGLIVCVVVMFICVCRLNVSQSMPLRVTLQQLMYICFALWAAGTWRELWRGQEISLHVAAVGLGILIQLLLSYKQWKVQEALVMELSKREACGLPQNKRPLWLDEGDEHASTRC